MTRALNPEHPGACGQGRLPALLVDLAVRDCQPVGRESEHGTTAGAGPRRPADRPAKMGLRRRIVFHGRSARRSLRKSRPSQKNRAPTDETIANTVAVGTRPSTGPAALRRGDFERALSEPARSGAPRGLRGGIAPPEAVRSRAARPGPSDAPRRRSPPSSPATPARTSSSAGNPRRSPTCWCRGLASTSPRSCW
jgi:hypothetical protein